MFVCVSQFTDEVEECEGPINKGEQGCEGEEEERFPLTLSQPTLSPFLLPLLFLLTRYFACGCGLSCPYENSFLFLALRFLKTKIQDGSETMQRQ